jgi:hypothetical protein
MDHISMFIFDLRMISMLSKCEYDWYGKILTCSTEYKICDSFASLTCQQISYYGSDSRLVMEYLSCIGVRNWEVE